MYCHIWFGLTEFIHKDRGRELEATKLILSHPHIFRVTRAPCFVARWGIEPQTIRLKGECFNHCATDLVHVVLDETLFLFLR